MTDRARELCWWNGAAFYVFLCYVLYKLLSFFPVLQREYGEIIYSVAWMPLAAVAWYAKNRLEEWVCYSPSE